MAWYDEYYNKKAPTGNYYYVEKDKMLYPEYMMCIHPRNANSVRWYNYYKDDNGKLIRVTEKMKMSRKVRWKNEQMAQEIMPEYFL